MTTTKKEKIICHVCGKEKKPYTIFMKNDILSMLKYLTAREDGEICERCDQYYALTSEFKNATEEEFENAKKAFWFAQMMLKWWEKDKKMEQFDEGFENKRDWEGTEPIAEWCRKELNKKEEFKCQE